MRLTRCGVMAVILAVPACYSPVEHDVVSEAGVVKIRVSDNTIAGQVTGIPDGRALCSLGNLEFAVSSGTGAIYRFDSQSMTMDTSFTIGYASGSGYRDMIVPKTGSLYVIGGSGGLIEVGLDDDRVLSQFAVGSMPVALCASATSGRFYVADGDDRRIREVDSEGNLVLRQSEALPAQPVAVAAESFQNQLLLSACSDEEGTVGLVALSTFHAGTVQLGNPCGDVAAFPAESIWAAVHPRWNHPSGEVTICSNLYSPEISHVPLSGHPLRICSVPGTTLFYCLGYLGNGMSRISAVNYLTGDVVAELDVAGFPWDITSHANGEFVLALTSGI